MNKTSVSIQKSVEVITLGNAESAKNIWICIHGYGQQAQFFAKHFEVLAQRGDYVIVPNAINDYYLEGFSGRVGSNWMTTYNREQAIEDQIGYANTIYQQLVKPYATGTTRLHILGFSQGAYTASRWAVCSQLKPETLICWAGKPSDELLQEPLLSKMKQLKLAMARGDEDHFITPERLSEIKNSEWYRALDFKEFPFNGGHKMHAATLRQVLDWVGE